MMTTFLAYIYKKAIMMVVKINGILGTLYGWLCAGWLLIINFVAGYERAVCAVAVCVALDTFWGIAAQVKQGRFALSELGREGMLSKCALYASMIIAFIHIERAADISSHLTVIVICSLICLVEVWSMSGSALIINPRMPFLRIFRKVLMGEIARKMGNITTEQVEEYFNQAEQKNDDESNNKRLQE